VDWVPWLIALAVFAAYSVISVSRYLQLEPGSWDLGIFTEYVKQIAHLHAPVVSIRGPGFNLLGDHFQPIVALVAPFFRLAPSPVTLLLAQALLTALSVIPVSRAARAKLGTTAGWVIGAAYGFSWGLQQMIDFDFHEIAFAVPLLACSLSALLRGKTRAAVIWALPLVFIKEDQGFTVAALGLIILVKAWRAHSNSEADAGLFLLLWGIAWSLVAIVVIIPHFNVTHQYPYWNDGGAIGAGTGQHPISALAGQVTNAYRQKLETTAMILLPVAFLALRSPIALVALPSLALRFLSVNSYFWGTTWHYNATVMPIAFIAAIDTLARVRAARAGTGRVRRALATATIRLSLVAMLAIAAVLALHFPLDGLGNSQTYLIDQHVRAENAAMAKVPDGTTVETTLTMLAPLAARDDTFWIGARPNPPPQYIVFDESNSGWDPAPSNVLTFVEQRHPGVAYQQIFLDDDVYVFHRS
jgi:uncharacterized membrane protein